eukprot:m.1769 g.1769  ORF g.1769 m.1769 type:complete len:961 (+) comp7813_c0_seq1:191-3073(+)
MGSTKCSAKFDCINAPLRRFFHQYGRLIGRHPWPFIIVPFLLCGLLGLGLLRHGVERTWKDVEFLMAPTDSRSLYDREEMSTFFLDSLADESFSPARVIDSTPLGVVIVTPKKVNGSLLTDEVLDEVLRLDETVWKVHVGDSPRYFSGADSDSSLCRRWANSCYEDPILTMIKRNRDELKALDFTFPTTNDGLLLAYSLGGVDYTMVNGTADLHSVHSLSVKYFLRDNPDSLEWESAFVKAVEEFNAQSNVITIYRSYSQAISEGADDNVTPLRLYFPLTGVLVTLFTCFSLYAMDPVLAKPWVGAMGVAAVGLALVASFGFLAAIDFPLTIYVFPVLFLIVGIGVDDMFIMVHAFRLSGKCSVTERMGEAMAEAALSITITSVTDILAFGISAITPFRGTLTFSVYAALSVVTVYLTQVTFCAGCIVLDGRREHANRHFLTFLPVLPKTKELKKKRPIYSLFCTAKPRKRGSVPGEMRVPSILPVEILKSRYSSLLVKPSAKVVMAFLYCGFLAISVYGCTQLREGMSLDQVLMDDSEEWDYHNIENTDFRTFTSAVQFYTTERLAYWDHSVQEKLKIPIERVKSETNTVDEIGPEPVFWLNYYRQFLIFVLGTDQVNQTTFMEYLPVFFNLSCIAEMDEFREFVTNSALQSDLSNLLKLYTSFQQKCGHRFDQSLIDVLYQRLSSTGSSTEAISNLWLLSLAASEVALDITISEDKQWIEASRFIVPTHFLKTIEDERDMMLDYRGIADDSNLTAYHLLFPIYDSYLRVLPNTLQNIGIGILVMSVVALLMIPNPFAGLLIVANIISIDVGVVGFMALWGFTLNSVTTSSIIMSIGVAVDYCAHVTYSFMVAKGDSRNERMREAIVSVGWPVIQGACTTVLAMSLLIAGPSYIYRAGCATLLLVILIAALHGIVFLPVLLSVIGPMPHIHDEEPKEKVESKVDRFLHLGIPVSYETAV